MFRSYLKTAFRNLWRRKSYTLLHVFGLSMGLATCLLVYLYVQHEMSFDQYHQQADRTYRVNVAYSMENRSDYNGESPFPMAPAIRMEFPEVEKVARISQEGDGQISIENQQFQEKNILFVEPEFTEILDYKFLIGNAQEALAQPNQVFLSTSTAIKYFGATTAAIGQRLKLNNALDLEVAGIFEDSPTNTHQPANMMISFASFTKEFHGFDPANWGMVSSGATYLTLAENQSPAIFQEQLQTLVKKYMKEDGVNYSFVLQPLKDIHFNTKWSSDAPVTPINPTYLWVFGLIGIFVLLLACINFINLATAQAVERSKEVSVRKVMGARIQQLIGQYMSEAYVITIFAAFVAIILAELSLPFLNNKLNQELVLNIWTNPQLSLFLLGSIGLVGLLAGYYPSFVLSRYEPASALKSQHTTGKGRSVWLRRSLVTTQFIITFIILIGTLVVSKQLSYCKNKDLGFDKEAILLLDIPEQENFETMRSEWLRNPNIDLVSFSVGAPTSGNGIGLDYGPVEKKGQFYSEANVKIADHHYADVFGLQLIAGRFLNERDAMLSSHDSIRESRQYVFVVNETLVEELGYTSPEEILGQRLFASINSVEAEVVGVVKDFNMSSLHDEIDPMIMMNFSPFYVRAAMKINTTNLDRTIAHVEEVWSNQYPEYMFKYNFMDEQLDNLYASENRLFFLFSILAGIAILIGCLGLWGLVAYTTQQRTKEIGLRKILGASIPDIVLMLSNEFTLLVILAFVVASPIAWYSMSQWLENFTYAIQPSIGIFVTALVLTLGVALLTVSFKAVRAALYNPVDALRHE